MSEANTMTTQTEALKLALEALKVAEHFVEEYAASKYYYAHVVAIAAAEEALAQPEQRSVSEQQEPVAWWIPKAEQFCLPSSDGTRPFAKAWEPLYTTPPQRTWVGLDPEEIRKTNHHMVDGAYHYSFKQGAEWAEAKLKEKNT